MGCVVIEPAQFHLTSMNEGVARIGKTEGGAHTRRWSAQHPSADHGVCVGLWRTSSDGTSRLFTVHRMGMLGDIRLLLLLSLMTVLRVYCVHE